jgi:hypothetical protein
MDTIIADAADIGAVATNINSVTTVSGISGDVTTVASKASDVETVADNIGDVQAASQNATNAAASAQAAASSASTAGTHATNASASANQAANSATGADDSEAAAGISASAASSSASAASSSASSAASSASDANDSQSAAALSASGASVSASAAAVSAGNSETAAATWNNFYTTYLGAAASAPSTDLLGQPLQDGALYFNTTDDTMYVFNGSIWIAAESTINIVSVPTQLAADLTTNGNDVKFGDNDKAKFGASSDLQIYHDGGNSRIYDQGTGALVMRSNQLNIQSPTGEKLALFNQNSDVELYYDNALKLATTSTGIDVTGTATMDGLTVNSGTSNLVATFESTDLGAGVDFTDSAGTMRIETNNGAFRLYGNTTSYPRVISAGANGDISFYEDTGTTPKLFWDASAESLGIGTTTTTGTLNIQDGTPTIRFYDSNLVTRQMEINAENGNAIIKVDPNQTEGTSYYSVEIDASERMRIDSSGRLGIGTSSPAYTLDVASSTDAVVRILGDKDNASGEAGKAQLYLANDGGANGFFLLNENVGGSAGALSFGVRSNNSDTEAMRIDSSGRVGIGTSSPTRALEVYDTTSAHLNIKTGTSGISYLNFGDTDDDNVGRVEYAHSGNSMQFFTAAAERMRIDSAGNLLVGTTSGSRKLEVHADNVPPMRVRRNTSDGNLVEYYKDGTTVGSIGTASGQLGVNSQGTRLNLQLGGTTKAYVRSGSLNPSGDNTFDLGESSERFKDLYLSGGVRLQYPGNSYYAKVAVDSSTNLILGAGPNGSERARIDSSGNLLVGTTEIGPVTDGARLMNDGQVRFTSIGTVAYLNRSGTAGTIQEFRQANTSVGYISVTGSATSYNTSSDQRLKENIADADDAGSKIDAIQVRKYDWKADGSHQDYGMIAQELQAVAPEAVSGDADSDEMMGVDYSKLVPMLIKEIQSLRNRVASLEE